MAGGLQSSILQGSDSQSKGSSVGVQNTSTNIYRACKELKTDKRVALTGYPLQNNLNEYYHMLYWAQGECGFGTVPDFQEYFGNPIMKGGDLPSSPYTSQLPFCLALLDGPIKHIIFGLHSASQVDSFIKICTLRSLFQRV